MFLEVRAREVGAKRLERAPRGRRRGWLQRRAGDALTVLVVVSALGVRDEGDGLEAGALEAARDEGVRELGTAWHPELEDDTVQVFDGAVIGRVGAFASHAELVGGRGEVAGEVEGDGVLAQVAMPPSTGTGCQQHAAVATAGKG